MSARIEDLIRPTLAQHPSTCGDCELPIRVGQAIVLAGGAGWVHDVCGAFPEPRPVCGTCFLEIPLNGDCEC